MRRLSIHTKLPILRRNSVLRRNNQAARKAPQKLPDQAAGSRNTVRVTDMWAVKPHASLLFFAFSPAPPPPAYRTISKPHAKTPLPPGLPFPTNATATGTGTATATASPPRPRRQNLGLGYGRNSSPQTLPRGRTSPGMPPSRASTAAFLRPRFSSRRNPNPRPIVVLLLLQVHRECRGSKRLRHHRCVAHRPRLVTFEVRVGVCVSSTQLLLSVRLMHMRKLNWFDSVGCRSRSRTRSPNWIS